MASAPPLGAALRFAGSWVLTLGFGVAALGLALVWGPERAWERLMPAWARCILRWSGVKVELSGGEHLREPAVILLNHVSFIDAVYPFAVLPPRTRLVTKKEMGRIPIVGQALRAAGAVLIDRKQGAQALGQLREAVRGLPSGWSLLMFPEGTRARQMEMLPFRRGAFLVAMEAGLPIVPVGTWGQLDVVPGDGVVMRPGRLFCTAGPPISTAGWTLDTLEAHMAEARAAMERCIAASRTRAGA